MLLRLLTQNRDELIERCRVKGVARTAPKATTEELQHGIPIFIDQLIAIMTQGVTEGSAGRDSQATAGSHGREMLQHGFTIDQVVHDYGDLCQAVTELAVARKIPIEVDEFRLLNRSLDNVIADAVTAFASQRDFSMPDKTQALNERACAITVELQALVHTAALAVTALRAGNVGIAGATGTLLQQSLLSADLLLERSLNEYRENSEKAVQH